MCLVLHWETWMTEESTAEPPFACEFAATQRQRIALPRGIFQALIRIKMPEAQSGACWLWVTLFPSLLQWETGRLRGNGEGAALEKCEDGGQSKRLHGGREQRRQMRELSECGGMWLALAALAPWLTQIACHSGPTEYAEKRQGERSVQDGLPALFIMPMWALR